MARASPSPYAHPSPSQSSDSLSDADADALDTSKAAFYEAEPVALSPARWTHPRRSSLFSQPASPISRLPAEIIIHVLRYIHSSRDLSRALLVSRTWCACSVELLWHKPAFSSVGTLVKMIRVLGSETQTFTYAAFVRRLNFLFLGPDLTDSLFSRVAQCVRLERLTLVNCRSLTDDALTQVLGSFPHLVALDLTSVSDVTDRALLALAASSRRLQGINLGGCKKVTDRGVLALARNCPLLRRVKLSGLEHLTDEAVAALARNCPLLLEVDLNHCKRVSDAAGRELWVHSVQMREMRLSHLEDLTDLAFPASSRHDPPLLLQPNKGPNPFPNSSTAATQQATTAQSEQQTHMAMVLDQLQPLRPPKRFEHLRMLDLTNCVFITDDAIDGIVTNAPKIRNLVLAKCSQLTDRSVETICRLGKHLHYLHLGHCLSITDSSVKNLARSCTRLRYIDLANCTNLTDMAVFELSSLPKLRRVGLVRVTSLTDEAIYALGERHATLERIHLSYCNRISIMSIHFLLQKLPKLTHLSLTGIPAFRRPELQKFCRMPPPEFNPSQRNAFCVFSGKGVTDLRDYLTALFKAISKTSDDGTEFDEEETYVDQYPATYMDDEMGDGYDGEMDADMDGGEPEHPSHNQSANWDHEAHTLIDIDPDLEGEHRHHPPTASDSIAAPAAVSATGPFTRPSLEPTRGSTSSVTLRTPAAIDTPPTAVGTPMPEPPPEPPRGPAAATATVAAAVPHSGFGSHPLVEETVPASPPPPSEAGSGRSAQTSGSGAAFFRTYAQRAVSPQGSGGSRQEDGALTPDLIFAEIGHGRGAHHHHSQQQQQQYGHGGSFFPPMTNGLGSSTTAGAGSILPPGAVANAHYVPPPHPGASSAPTSHQLPFASGVISTYPTSNPARHPPTHNPSSPPAPSILPGGVGFPMGALGHHHGAPAHHPIPRGENGASASPGSNGSPWGSPPAQSSAFASLSRIRDDLPPPPAGAAAPPSSSAAGQGWMFVNRAAGSAGSSADDLLLVEQEGGRPQRRRGLKSTLSAAEHFLFGRGEGSGRRSEDGVGPRGH